MDPASLSNLDPKLRETYERVMGTTGSAASTPPTPPTDSTTPATPAPAESTPTSSETPAPVAPTDSTAPQASVTTNGLSIPTVDPILTNTVTQDQPQTVTIDQPLPNPAASNVITPPPHGHMGLIKVFYVLGGLVFFVIYILFWLKILNFSLPF